MFDLRSSLISKRNQFKKNSLYYDLIDELIEIIDDINNLKFAEEAKNIIEELNELKKEFIDDKEYINIIDTQIKNVHDNISKLAIKNDPITIRIRELEKNKPQCTNKNCSNLLEIKNTTTNDFFWSCPDFPKCWGKKRLTNEEYFFITKGTLIPEKKKLLKKILSMKKFTTH